MRIDDEPEISDELRAPFPYFGGKRRVAEFVWERFGDPHTYNEPFFGSGAVLLGRPHAPRVETVNDLDCYLANFWRALQHDPEQVAYHADSPVNEADLHARHRWLVEHARPIAERCMTEPEFFDAKIAGWWVWGQCLWIGSGWCQAVATERRTEQSAKRPKLRERGTDGVPYEQSNNRHANGTRSELVPNWKQRPDLSAAKGRGGVVIERSAATRSRENPSQQRKRFASPGNGQGTGVHRRWQGGGERGGGSGVHAVGLHKSKPHLAGDSGATGKGIHATAFDVKTGGLYDYLFRLAARLRRVRVCCGDWKRVLTPSVTTYIGPTAVFLDPPYAHDLRERCYSEDHDISAEVRTWAIAHGDDPHMRIALCGYEGEHNMPTSWDCVPWKAHGGYSRSERGVANRDRERIWFSPHCLPPSQPSLFEGQR